MPEPYGGGGRGADALPAVFAADAAAVSTAGATDPHSGLCTLWENIPSRPQVQGRVVLVLSAGVTAESIG
jgi:hypothetical protein